MLYLAEHKRILIVDDDEPFAGLVALILENDRRFATVIATTAAEVLPRAHEFDPDLILLDLNMPEKNGDEIFLDLRRDLRLAGIPIVFITGDIWKANALVRTEPYVGTRILAKPFAFDKLIECVAETLHLGAGAAHPMPTR